MIHFFKKGGTVTVCTPCKGSLIPIENVKDTMFSKKLLGDGFAVLPAADVICSPCEGKISVIADSLHAFGVSADNGAEILVHIGLDTVDMKGEGFRALAKVGQRVKAGSPVIKMDVSFLKERNLDLTIPVILTNGEEFCVRHMLQEGTMDCGSEVVKIEKN